MGKFAIKMTYIGAGAGIALFLIFGLLPGSFIGGSIGLLLAKKIMGAPVAIGVVSKFLVAISMFTGVLISGFVFLISCSSIGWLVGTLLDKLKQKRRGRQQSDIKTP